MEAMLDNPSLASSMGVNVARTNVFLITAASAIGALGGVIFAFNLGTMYPDTFRFFLLLYGTTMLVIGGRQTMWGAVFAAPVLTGLPHWLPYEISNYSRIIYGVLLVTVLILRPQGVITRGLLQRISKGIGRMRRRVTGGSGA